jgi:hypothetical protein
MRRSAFFASTISLFMFSSACTTQQPQTQTTPPKESAPTAQVHGNLAQVMRGIFFPNSNVIFAAQGKNPAEIKPAADPATSTDPLTNTYGGWTAVENSGVAIAEAANLLMIPGRLCSNGKPVPMQNADWPGLVDGLRKAGMTAAKAAQSKNQDAIVDAAGSVTEACAACHDKYRDKPGGDAARCM